MFYVLLFSLSMCAFQANKNLTQLPNFAFSLALAMHNKAVANNSCTKDADNLVSSVKYEQSILLLFLS